MKILFVTTEIVPYIKAGGLADVSGALPKALENRGHEIRIILPKHGVIDSQEFKLSSTAIKYSVPDFEFDVELETTTYPASKMVVYFIKCDYFYNRPEIYGDYEDNAERFIFFSKAVLELLKYIDWKPDIIHCNEWQTALIPALLKNLYPKNPIYANIKVLFTIHNLAYQGVFSKEKFTLTGLDRSLFTPDLLEFWGKINFLKGGLIYADLLNTVSEKYATEIQTPEFGCGLERVLLQRKADLFGILNGIDYNIWNPRMDSYIWYKYDENSVDKKQLNKRELQKVSNLPQKDVPLIGIVSRLADQKGLDLIGEIIEELLQNFEFQFVLLGTGNPKYHQLFTEIKKNNPIKTAIFLKFDDNLAHKIEAGADFFLMPSQYEPCGLNQLISLHYGTIPIVRHTGGLADSVSDIEEDPNSGVGFVFHNYNSQELLQTIIKALNFYSNKKARLLIMKRGMQKDFSWNRSAQKYEHLYLKLLQKF